MNFKRRCRHTQHYCGSLVQTLDENFELGLSPLHDFSSHSMIEESLVDSVACRCVVAAKHASTRLHRVAWWRSNNSFRFCRVEPNIVRCTPTARDRIIQYSVTFSLLLCTLQCTVSSQVSTPPVTRSIQFFYGNVTVHSLIRYGVVLYCSLLPSLVYSLLLYGLL